MLCASCSRSRSRGDKGTAGKVTFFSGKSPFWIICSRCPSQLLLCTVPAQEAALGPPRSLGAQPEAVPEIRVPPDAVGMGTCSPVPSCTGVASVCAKPFPCQPVSPLALSPPAVLVASTTPVQDGCAQPQGRGCSSIQLGVVGSWAWTLGEPRAWSLDPWCHLHVCHPVPDPSAALV